MQVNEHNYHEALIRHLEGELSAEERYAVETYIASHAGAAEEWRRLQHTRLKPDIRVTFPNKARLYRTEEPAETAVVRKLTPYPYLKYLSAIAAALIFAAIYFILRPQQGAEPTDSLVKEEPVRPEQKSGPTAVAPQDNQIAQGNTTKPDPDKEKEKKKDEKKKAPKKPTIIIVEDPVRMPEKQRDFMAVTHSEREYLIGHSIRPVSVSAANDYIYTEAETIPESYLAEADTRVDFMPAGEEEYVNTFTRVYRFLTRNVSLRREVQDEEMIYAFRLETKNVSIYKTFRGF